MERPRKEEDIARITAPVHGFYAENDARVDATIDKSKELMQKHAKHYQPEIYPGAGHGFMRAGEAPDASAANKKARTRHGTGGSGCLKGCSFSSAFLLEQNEGQFGPVK
jgi:dienelactone hydrolase